MELLSSIRNAADDLHRSANDVFSSDERIESTSEKSNGTNDATSMKKSNSSNDQSEWRAVESPTSKALFGVVGTTAGPFAVGTGGNVLTKHDGQWRFAIEAGPATRENTLTCVDATADGKRIWFAGSSGALGCYDVEAGKKYDYSAPNEKTSTWEAIAVDGKRGNETLRVANGSGEVLPVTTDDNGCPKWGEVVKPGSGSTVPALDFGDDNAYAVDTSGNAFEERKKGWKDIGVTNAQVNFFDVYAGDGNLLIAGGGGRVYRYDRPCKNWTPIDAGEGALHAIAAGKSKFVVAGASGYVYERLSGAGWTKSPTPVETDLQDVSVGDIDVAVGAGGTIVER